MSSTTLTSEQIETLVYDTLASFGQDRDELRRDATFEELDVDSLDLAELSQVVDEQVGVQLKGSDMESIKTVGDALDLIVARTS